MHHKPHTDAHSEDHRSTATPHINVKMVYGTPHRASQSQRGEGSQRTPPLQTSTAYVS